MSCNWKYFVRFQQSKIIETIGNYFRHSIFRARVNGISTSNFAMSTNFVDELHVYTTSRYDLPVLRHTCYLIGRYVIHLFIISFCVAM
jgi:hypothetical protein